MSLSSFNTSTVHYILHYAYFISVRSFIDLYLTFHGKITTDPKLLPMVRIDRGAIRFLMAGANMMCPGMTSAGGYLPPDGESIPSGKAVAIFAEGKEHAVGIGLTKMSTEEIRRVNKNIGVENICYIGDDLWLTQKI